MKIGTFSFPFPLLPFLSSFSPFLSFLLLPPPFDPILEEFQFTDQSSEPLFQNQFEPQSHTFSIKQIEVTGNELQ
ncbi:hypothetical protein MSSIT_1759 [Methanosarcina siciliae T4/M]|uniref:Uncharacterized protein n=2 Tax=Methanosarcina siciliae TaxID=38027 RepID=A0A0E3PD66_9EURY|nr:hypothetical protein MSSIT_1759 [Methanosarcina siciliae T4/M]AKB32393.1 hypothetical protein MSSIH_1703 [Methanosarcina siciliae HI350]